MEGQGLETAAQTEAKSPCWRGQGSNPQGPWSATHAVTGGVCRIILAQTLGNCALGPSSHLTGHGVEEGGVQQLPNKPLQFQDLETM